MYVRKSKVHSRNIRSLSASPVGGRGWSGRGWYGDPAGHRLAASGVRFRRRVRAQELLLGGLGDRRPDKDFSKVQLKLGVKHEKEHTYDRKVAKEIAKDHLAEDPKYYTHLAEMERTTAKRWRPRK